jgi:hypothetical protein
MRTHELNGNGITLFVARKPISTAKLEDCWIIDDEGTDGFAQTYRRSPSSLNARMNQLQRLRSCLATSLSVKPLFNNEILEQRKLHYRIG